MKTEKRNNFIVNSIVNIPSQSLKLAVLALPPFHLIYFYALAVHARRAQRPGLFKQVLYGLGLFLVAGIISILFLTSLEDVFQTQLLKGQVLLSCSVFLSLHLMALLHLSLVTVEFERQQSSHLYFDFTDMDYFRRFFTLLFLPFTIWSFHQSLMNPKRDQNIKAQSLFNQEEEYN